MDKSVLKKKIGFFLTTNVVVFAWINIFGPFFFARYFMIWIFFSVFFTISVYGICFNAKDKIYNRHYKKFVLTLIIILFSILIIPSSECRVTSKSSSYLTRCDCVGIEKPTGLFSYGCIGIRTACYRNEGYDGVNNKYNDVRIACKSWKETWVGVLKNIIGKKETITTL